MMFRVYDTKEKKWVDGDKVMMSGFGDDLYMCDKKMFGLDKLTLVSPKRYIVQMNTCVNDKNGNPIYEGDVCDIELFGDDKRTVRCVVAYVPEQAAYKLLDDVNSCYYGFWNGFNDRITMVGNMLDGVEEGASAND